MKALLYHFHGIDDFDFSTISPEDLPEVQKAAESREYGILPTVYLRRENLPRLVEVLQEYHRLEQTNAVPNIAGFAIEGPLLGPQGGIPRPDGGSRRRRSGTSSRPSARSACATS